MKVAFLSISLRYLINMESLNGIESVGNISRHRVAPMIVPTDTGYSVRYVPAVSGETIAHAYQTLIADEAAKSGLPVGKRSMQGELLKFTDDGLLKEEGIVPPKGYEDMRRVEVDIMLKDIVSDIGGFMYTGRVPIKRTSAFQVSYMIPAYDSSETAALEAQFHVRFSPSNANYQIPYTVEVGSAIYSLSFNLDLDKISLPSNPGPSVEKEELLKKQKSDREKVSRKALIRLLDNLQFGAKKSRFAPIAEIKSAVGIVSDVPLVATPGTTGGFIIDTYNRVKSFEKHGVLKKYKLLAINKENIEIPTDVESRVTVADLINDLTL